MPRPHKNKDKYGGKKDKKRKRQQQDEDAHDGLPPDQDPTPKRPRSAEAEEADYMDLGADQGNYDESYGEQDSESQPLGGHDEFYGLLSDDDQAYFKRIEAMLELDQFESPEDKDVFLDSVWREAESKELKLACSQSCSRILERLLKASRPAHLKRLFQNFSGHFLFLVQHRFASHCCETLFLTSAPVVTQELIAPMEAENDETKESHDVYVSMENLFLYTANELLENMGFLMTDRFASHPLRVLLVVLSGKPLDESAEVSQPPNKSKKQSSQSETNNTSASTQQWRTVPESFADSVDKMRASIIGGLDTHYLRTLTTNPLASKVLQRLLELEFVHWDTSKSYNANTSLYRRLIPDDTPSEDSSSGRFLKGLVYDPAGSRLVEVIVQCSPSKVFARLHHDFFGPLLCSMARNETASFVAMRVLERLGAEDLLEALRLLEPELPTLLKRERYAMFRVLIERSRARDVDVTPLVAAIENVHGPAGHGALASLLHLAWPDDHTSAGEQPGSRGGNEVTNDPTKHHASLMCETMLAADDSAREYMTTCLLDAPSTLFFTIATDRHAAHVLQTALTSNLASSLLRPLVQNLHGHVPLLAPHPAGSRVVDALWMATDGPLFFLKESIVALLAKNGDAIRESFPGRAVFRNWRVELWARRRGEWIGKAKGRREESEFGGLRDGGKAKSNAKKVNPRPAYPVAQDAEKEASEQGVPGPQEGQGKTPIELARERWLAKKNVSTPGKARGQDARVVSVR